MNQNPYDPPDAVLEPSEVLDLRKPNLFLYSLILPLVWISFGTLTAFLLPGVRLGMFGLVLVLHITFGIICWRFSKTFCRQFDRPESYRLIAYSSIWALLLEAASLCYYLASQSQLDRAHFSLLVFSLSFTAVLDIVLIASAVLFVAKRFLNYFLSKQGAHTA
jgi:hypothetical protein